MDAKVPSRLEDLERLRGVLWVSILQADPEKRAPLVARMESVIQQIDDLTPSEKAGDPIDEIAARRSARGGATSRLGRTAGSKG